MGRAAPELRDDAGDTRQNGRQRRTGDLRDEDVAELDVLEVVLVEHDARRARRPAHTRRLTREAGMPEPHFVGRVSGLDVERTRVLEEALRRIGDDQRTAIVLFDVEGYDYAEIATMTGVSLGTVKSRIHRGRLALRTLLEARMELFRG